MTATPKKKGRKATKARPSPVVALTPNTTKKAKKSVEVAILKAAANDVLRMRNDDGTRAVYGSMDKVIKRYHTLGHAFVTRGKIQFHIKKILDALASKPPPPLAPAPPEQVAIPGSATTATSDLSSLTGGSQQRPKGSNSANDGLWSFRPSALHRDYKNLSRQDLFSSYLLDCRRATLEGVFIPPRTRRFSLRTLQWNVHNFIPPCRELDRHQSAYDGILFALDQANADILVLNEYTWGQWSQDGRNLFRSLHSDFEAALEERNYTLHQCGALASTAIATRVPVDQVTDIVLGHFRHALAMRLVEENVWIYGTHLCDHDGENGEKRFQELQPLLLHASMRHDKGRVLIAGDFNQQRQQDYTMEEWTRICQNKAKRQAPETDFVAETLAQAGYTCNFDATIVATAKRNWPPTDPPPSTHWTGTIVDYTYFRNLQLLGVYVSPSAWSDHRMTVCDWTCC